MHPRLPFEQHLADAWPLESWQDVSILVAVSGGPDSVALLRALCRMKHRDHDAADSGRLIVGHVNHALRPQSNEDEAFVQQLARNLGAPCKTGRVSVAAADTGDGLEAAAREARYQFLQTTAEDLGARYVVTAHTADDQAETIMHRIVRGTGLSGLAGIPRARPLGRAVSLLRPMLEISRTEVEAYLTSLGQSWRVDESNLDLRFTRNRIRHELLPLLAEDFNPQVKRSLLRLGKLADEARSVIDTLVEELALRSVASTTGAAAELDCRPLLEAPRYLVRELFSVLWRRQGWPLQAMSYGHFEQLATLATGHHPANPPVQMFPGNVSVERSEYKLLLRRN